MRHSSWVSILVFLAMIFVMSLWCIDISLSAILVDGTLTSGWWIRNPMTSYHIGIYLSCISFFAVVPIAIHHMLRGE